MPSTRLPLPAPLIYRFRSAVAVAIGLLLAFGPSLHVGKGSAQNPGELLAVRRDALLGRFNRVGVGVTRRPPSLWVTSILIRA